MSAWGLTRRPREENEQLKYQPSRFSAVIGRPGSSEPGRPITALNREGWHLLSRWFLTIACCEPHNTDPCDWLSHTSRERSALAVPSIWATRNSFLRRLGWPDLRAHTHTIWKLPTLKSQVVFKIFHLQYTGLLPRQNSVGWIHLDLITRFLRGCNRLAPSVTSNHTQVPPNSSESCAVRINKNHDTDLVNHT